MTHRQSVRTVKTYSSGSVSGGLGGGLGMAIGSGIGSGFSVTSGTYGGSSGARSSRRYAQSAIGVGSRPMSYSVSSARYGSSTAGGYGTGGYGAAGIIMGGGAMGGGAMGGGMIMPTISNVQANSSLLAPVPINIDPNIQVVRNNEKEQIKTLNNRFAGLIEKVSDASLWPKEITSEVFFYHIK